MDEPVAANIDQQAGVMKKVSAQQGPLDGCNVKRPLVDTVAELQAYFPGAVGIDLTAVGSGEGPAPDVVALVGGGGGDDADICTAVDKEFALGVIVTDKEEAVDGWAGRRSRYWRPACSFPLALYEQGEMQTLA